MQMFVGVCVLPTAALGAEGEERLVWPSCEDEISTEPEFGSLFSPLQPSRIIGTIGEDKHKLADNPL